MSTPGTDLCISVVDYPLVGLQEFTPKEIESMAASLRVTFPENVRMVYYGPYPPSDRNLPWQQTLPDGITPIGGVRYFTNAKWTYPPGTETIVGPPGPPGHSHVDARDIYLTASAGGIAGTGASDNPYDVSTRDKFLVILQSLSAQNQPTNFHFAPGTYYLPTSIRGGGAGAEVVLWRFRNGWHWHGAGMGRTIFVADLPVPGEFNFIISNWSHHGEPVIPTEHYIIQASLNDLTIDGRRMVYETNIGQRGVFLFGDQLATRRVEICNIGGDLGEFFEEFVLLLTCGNTEVASGSTAEVSDCYLHDIRFQGPDQMGTCGGINVSTRIPDVESRQYSTIRNNRLVAAGEISFGTNSQIVDNYSDAAGLTPCIHGDTGTCYNLIIARNFLLRARYPFGHQGIIRLGGSSDIRNVQIYDNISSLENNGFNFAFIILQGNVHVSLRNNVMIRGDLVRTPFSYYETGSGNVILEDINNRMDDGEYMLGSLSPFSSGDWSEVVRNLRISHRHPPVIDWRFSEWVGTGNSTSRGSNTLDLLPYGTPTPTTGSAGLPKQVVFSGDDHWLVDVDKSVWNRLHNGSDFTLIIEGENLSNGGGPFGILSTCGTSGGQVGRSIFCQGSQVTMFDGAGIDGIGAAHSGTIVQIVISSKANMITLRVINSAGQVTEATKLFTPGAGNSSDVLNVGQVAVSRNNKLVGRIGRIRLFDIAITPSSLDFIEPLPSLP